VTLADAGAGDIIGVLFWCIVLIGLIIGGYFVVVWIRKKLKDEDLSDTGEGGFSLTELRELHADGKLTRQEFEKAKYAIVEAAKAAGEARANASAEARAASKPPAKRSTGGQRGSFL
jgi:hypothetical protein